MADWVILCNQGSYNIHGAFNKLDTLDWKQSTNVEPGDNVYIYVGVPDSAICYKCEAIETELNECGIDDSEFVLDDTNYGGYGRYMRLHLLEKYDNPLLKREYLLSHGLKTVRGPSQVDSELVTYINLVIQNNVVITEHSSGRSVNRRKYEKEVQDARDAQYPQDFVTEIGVTIEHWKKLLKNSDIFSEEDIRLLKRFYLADNHAMACFDLGLEDGVVPQSFISPVVNLARRISTAANIEPVIRENGKPAWWRIPFWGREREDGHFEWKLRPKLAQAMSELYPELDVSVDFIVEAQEDDVLVSSLKTANVAVTDGFEYTGKPKEKEEPIISNGHKVYPRDRKTAMNALAHADYMCEINPEHPTFIRRNSGKNYTEPHHLVPMAFQDEFDVSLDVEENIVSLCSNCHNCIHYGEEAEELIKKLYEERKVALESVGIYISLEKLLVMYN